MRERSQLTAVCVVCQNSQTPFIRVHTLHVHAACHPAGGQDLVLEYMMGAATVAVGWSGYATSLLKDMGVVLPPSLASGACVWVQGASTCLCAALRRE